MNTYSRPAGFTLIELLVVIAIIGVLASIVLVSLNDARAQGRDARMISDFRSLQQALELYRNQTGHYPTPSPGEEFWDSSSSSGDFTNWPNVCPPLAGNWLSDNGNTNWSNAYLAQQPKHQIATCAWPVSLELPLGGTYYTYHSDGNFYLLMGRFENPDNPNSVQGKGGMYWFEVGVGPVFYEWQWLTSWVYPGAYVVAGGI